MNTDQDRGRTLLEAALSDSLAQDETNLILGMFVLFALTDSFCVFHHVQILNNKNK